MQNWAGHVAVVTGAASGLGAATAQALTDLGMRIAIFDMNITEGQAVAANLGGLFVSVDVSDPASVSQGFATVATDLGTPRVVVNCAGASHLLQKPCRAARCMMPRCFNKRLRSI